MKKRLTLAPLKESEIEMAICHYLYFEKICFWKQTTRGFFDTRVGRFRKDRNPYVMSGHPDLFLIFKGHLCGLEIKTPKGRQSPNQISFAKFLIEKGGATYEVVTSVVDAKAALNRFRAKVAKALQPVSTSLGLDVVTQMTSDELIKACKRFYKLSIELSTKNATDAAYVHILEQLHHNGTFLLQHLMELQLKDIIDEPNFMDRLTARDQSTDLAVPPRTSDL